MGMEISTADGRHLVCPKRRKSTQE